MLTINFPFLSDGLDDRAAIEQAVVAAHATYRVRGDDYTITFPSETAALDFLNTAYPYLSVDEHHAIITAGSSINF